MGSTALLFEILVLFVKVIPIVVGTIGALLFLSPKRLPKAIASRWYLYWPTLIVIYTIAVVAFISVIRDISRFLIYEDSNEIVLSEQTATRRSESLPPVKVPPVVELPLSKGPSGQTATRRSESLPPVKVLPVVELPLSKGPSGQTGAFAVADVTIGMPMVEAVRIITGRDKTCFEIEVEDRSWTGITVTIPSLDPVFQNPKVLECYRDPKHFEHIYLFPDIYETNNNVFAIARVSKFKDLRVQDIRELLERRYGPAQEPSYQPNYGTHLYWLTTTSQQINVYLKKNEDCFLYLPRAMKSSLDGVPVSHGNNGARAQLNSSELQGDCGLVLGAFISNRDRQMWLFVTDTSRVQNYKQYAKSREAANEIERVNKARRGTKF